MASAFEVSAHTNNNEDPGEVYEQRHVHDVYQEIAPHFSSTRYKVCTSLHHQHKGEGIERRKFPCASITTGSVLRAIDIYTDKIESIRTALANRRTVPERFSTGHGWR